MFGGLAHAVELPDRGKPRQMDESPPLNTLPTDGRGAEKGLQGFQDTHKREWLSAQRAIDVGQFLVSRLLPELQMDRGCATDRSGGFCLVRVDEPGVERLPIWTIRR